MIQTSILQLLTLFIYLPLLYSSMMSVRGYPSKNITRSAQISKCQLFDYPFTNLTIFFFFLQIFANIYLIIKYNQPEFFDQAITPFIYQNEALLVFSPAGLLIYQAFYGLKYGQANYGKILIFALLGLLGISFFQFIIIGLTKISISQFDLYLFFGSSAISEEFLFRYGIQLGLEKVFKIRLFAKSGSCEYLSVILAILTSSFFFALYHYFVKNLVNLMLAVLVSGIVLGIILRLSKSIDACIIAHFLVNILVTALG
jgi:membrane protease YdiL (CAAX protease family)